MNRRFGAAKRSSRPTSGEGDDVPSGVAAVAAPETDPVLLPRSRVVQAPRRFDDLLVVPPRGAGRRHTPEEGALIDPRWHPSQWLRYRWKAQEDNVVGGWCVTREDLPGTPADGNPALCDFATEDIARHVAHVHNEWLERS